MRTIMRLGTLAISFYAAIWFLSHDNVERDYASGGLTSWVTFVPGMLLLVFTVYYAVILFNGWNKPTGFTRTKVDIYSAAFFRWNDNRPVRRRHRQQTRALRQRQRQYDMKAYAESISESY